MYYEKFLGRFCPYSCAINILSKYIMGLESGEVTFQDNFDVQFHNYRLEFDWKNNFIWGWVKTIDNYRQC